MICLFTLGGCAELLQVHLGHALEEVEGRVVRRRRTDEDRSPGHATGQEGGAREGVRPAARDAHKPEALEPEVIGQGFRIGGRRGNPATWTPGSIARIRAGHTRSSGFPRSR